MEEALIHGLLHIVQNRQIVGTVLAGDVAVFDGELGDVKLLGELGPVILDILVQTQHDVADGLHRIGLFIGF